MTMCCTLMYIRCFFNILARKQMFCVHGQRCMLFHVVKPCESCVYGASFGTSTQLITAKVCRCQWGCFEPLLMIELRRVKKFQLWRPSSTFMLFMSVRPAGKTSTLTDSRTYTESYCEVASCSRVSKGRSFFSGYKVRDGSGFWCGLPLTLVSDNQSCLTAETIMA